MRPTFSIIFFTVMSGAGYGLWMVMALALLVSWTGSQTDGGMALMMSPELSICGLGAGFVLVSCGLVSSLGHLGQPQRAWRALSQWRSSWLSREGVAAILTYLPALFLLYALFDRTWMAPDPGVLAISSHSAGTLGSKHGIASALLLAGSLATVFCTANIYASLKPVRAWHTPHVAAGYLLLGIYSGCLWTWALSGAGHGSNTDLRALPGLVVLTGIASAVLKYRYWRCIDALPEMDAGEATGLASMGTVRSFEQPHTEENYLTHEMGFRVARKHSRKLRRISFATGIGLPVALVLSGLLFPSFAAPASWIALASGMTGIFVERWLFFAEARHTVMLYYGTRNT